MHLLGVSTSIFSVKCFKLPWLNRWGNGKTEHGKSSMIIKNSSSTKKKHDLSGEDSPWFLACKATWFLVWESRCTHLSVRVTHQPWGALGWEENCVPLRRAVSRVLFQGEESPSVPQTQGDEPTGRRGKQYLLRALAESVFPPLQGTLFCVGSFSWQRKPSSGLLPTQRGCWVPDFWGRCLARFWLPRCPTAQQVWFAHFLHATSPTEVPQIC